MPGAQDTPLAGGREPCRLSLTKCIRSRTTRDTQYTPGTGTTHGLTSATIAIKARSPEPGVGPSPQPATTAADDPVSAKMQTPANGSPNDERSTTLLPITTCPSRHAAAT